ncbi:hypothetical protein D3C71_2061830 [compost metagenome]
MLKQGPHVFAINPGQIVEHREVMTPGKLDKAHSLAGLKAGAGVFARVPNQLR